MYHIAPDGTVYGAGCVGKTSSETAKSPKLSIVQLHITHYVTYVNVTYMYIRLVMCSIYLFRSGRNAFDDKKGLGRSRIYPYCQNLLIEISIIESGLVVR